jgi:acyl-CoA thioester hydrolase
LERRKNFPLKVYYADTDSAGIVYYGTYMRWMEIGRCEFFGQLGFDLAEHHEEGSILVVANANLNYKKPARLGEFLDMNVWITEISPMTLKFNYQFLKTESNGVKTILVDAQTLMVCVDRKDLQLQAVPLKLISALEPYAN